MAGIILMVLAAMPTEAAEQPVSLEDLCRFPPAAVVKERLRLADERLTWMKEMSSFSRFWAESNVRQVEDAEWRREVWLSLEKAQREGGQLWRLCRLQRLRFALGRNYWTGTMPSPVPVENPR